MPPFVATDMIWERVVVGGTSSRLPGLEGPIFGLEGAGAIPDTVPMERSWLSTPLWPPSSCCVQLCWPLFPLLSTRFSPSFSTQSCLVPWSSPSQASSSDPKVEYVGDPSNTDATRGAEVGVMGVLSPNVRGGNSPNGPNLA